MVKLHTRFFPQVIGTCLTFFSGLIDYTRKRGLGQFARLRQVNINSLPMVVDISTSEEVLGTYTGLYYVAGTLAAVVGPILNGWVIDLTGRNYNMIFFVTPAFFVLAILCMLGVTKGEAKGVGA